MNKTGRSCGTCNQGNFGAYCYTPTGRFKKDAVGTCEYEIPVPVLPSSVRSESARRNPFPKSNVWPTDGSECPLYAPKDK